MVILGTNSDAIDIMRFDYFGLNYDRIMGFLEIKKEYTPGSSLIHIPILQIKDISKIRPDTILVVDDQRGDAELLLKLFYNNGSMQFPRIIHLIPDSKRLSLKLTRLVEKFTLAIRVNLIRRAVLVLSIQLIRSGFWLKMTAKRVALKLLPISTLKKFIKKIHNI